MVSVQDFGKRNASRGISYTILLPKVYEVAENSRVMEQHIHFLIDKMARAWMIKHFLFSIMAGLIVEKLFMLFSVYNAVQ